MKVIVEADGGSRGNPGPAGYGAVVFTGDHAHILAERAESIGTATNNVAEYEGLIAGLTAAIELGADEVDVRMDSKLVVEQMSGRWQVKHADMQSRFRRAQDLAQGFSRITFTWIPRAENSHADSLANQAMDGAAAMEPAKAGAGEYRSPGWTSSTGKPTRLLLLRHGQTALSIEQRYSGRGNPPLTETGLAQAQAAAESIAKRADIGAIVCSPLGRTMQTAAEVGKAIGIEPVVMPDLIETDFGAWEGLTFAEAAAQYPAVHRRWLADETVAPPNGESFAAVRERIITARNAICERYTDQTVVVVSHVTPIKTLLQLALGVGPALLYRLHLDLASLSIAEFYPDGGSAVRLVNDTSYLK
ncbi:bifunctional RNase H/acid phosphatase [Smaragdicoccus niigatensis]|uniref:bifunctional RNase H/acid phosphatase n=1 Tax=Smaragdicoccus niigatensis TaxID=359359 RepID=UPI00036BA093|nr:bifunctional RNase H/acid phosphatase [Smaragdicoccus niigatensis]